MTSKRPLVAAFIAPALALVAGLGRWALQGSGNLYTATDKRFYVPDPDLGWRLAPEAYLWLGLDGLAVILGYAAAVAVAALLIHRRERRRSTESPRLRGALLFASVVPLIIPVAGFAGGTPPDGSAETVPDSALVSAAEIEASLPGAPAGVYKVIEHPGTLVAAKIKASGEAFEARFDSDVRGRWRGDPTDLSQPMSAEITVAVDSVKTGIEVRDTHAAEKLHSDEHPTLSFSLEAITGAARADDRTIAFRGEGVVTLMGAPIQTGVSGTVTELDEAARRRLELGARAALAVSATFSVDLEQTPVDTSGGAFNELVVPIRVSLVLINEGES